MRRHPPPLVPRGGRHRTACGFDRSMEASLRSASGGCIQSTSPYAGGSRPNDDVCACVHAQALEHSSSSVSVRPSDMHSACLGVLASLSRLSKEGQRGTFWWSVVAHRCELGLVFAVLDTDAATTRRGLAIALKFIRAVLPPSTPESAPYVLGPAATPASCTSARVFGSAVGLVVECRSALDPSQSAPLLAAMRCALGTGRGD